VTSSRTLVPSLLVANLGLVVLHPAPGDAWAALAGIVAAFAQAALAPVRKTNGRRVAPISVGGRVVCLLTFADCPRWRGANPDDEHEEVHADLPSEFHSRGAEGVPADEEVGAAICHQSLCALDGGCDPCETPRAAPKGATTLSQPPRAVQTAPDVHSGRACPVGGAPMPGALTAACSDKCRTIRWREKQDATRRARDEELHALLGVVLRVATGGQTDG